MSAVTNHNDRWSAVGAAIAQRIADLRLTYAELTQRSGISFKTLKAYEAGQEIKRRDKRRELQRALEWSDDSIDRILAGGEPVVVSRPDGELEALARRLQLDVEEALTGVNQKLREMDERLDRLEQRGRGTAGR